MAPRRRPCRAARPGRGRVSAAARGAAVLVVPLLAAACTPTSVTEQGRTIHGLYNFFMWVAAVVFLVVSALILWSIVRYRRRDDELPKQIHGNNTLELVWTLIPTVLVAVLIAATVQAQDKVLHRSSDAVQLKVTGFQWSWQFDYPEGVRVIGQPKQRPTMVVPVGRPIQIELVSVDVVHSFYVPKTLFKRQAIPGFPNHFELTFDQVGTYPGQCAQFCGVAHADMLFDVRVVSQSEYESWLRANSAASGGAGP